MRLKEILWSRWGEDDYDFAGIQLRNSENKSSELLGMQKYQEMHLLTLQT